MVLFKMLKKLCQLFSKNRYLVLVIVLGTVTWSLTMIRSGLMYDFGYGFWGPNGHDGIWHMALSESLSKGTLNNPVFAGEVLINYHLGFDLLLALISKITRVPISILYFQILPVIFSLLIGLLVYKFVFLWRKSKSQALWATLLVYISSGFGFVVTFIREGLITGESMFWSQQSVSTLVNPPYALSLIFLLSGLIFLLKYQKTHTTCYFLLTTACFSVLIFVKVYAGLLVLAGLFVLAVYQLVTSHQSLFTKLFFSVLVISSLLFFPFIDLKSGSLVFQPFWFLETLMSYSDRLGWERFYSAMTTFKMGKLWFKAILAYGAAFGIFLIGNMGVRVVGFDFVAKIITKKEKPNELIIFILSMVVAAVVIPTFFVQSGTPWNTIQFFYYYLFFFSIFAGISISTILNNARPIIKKSLLFFVIVFSILGSWSTLQHFVPPMPQAKISIHEIEALEFLENQPSGIVLTYPYDQHKAKEAESYAPRPLYFYESTAYVSFFSKKQVFLEDEVNLNIMGYDWKSWREKVLWFISNLDQEKGREFLKENNIKYLYLVKDASPLAGEILKLGEDDLGLTKIFENNEALVFVKGIF